MKLEAYLRSIQSSPPRSGEGPPSQPSQYGPIELPQPGQSPQEVLLASAGLPIDLLRGILQHRKDEDFFERIYHFAQRVHDRFPRLLRQVAWELLREDPALVRKLAKVPIQEGGIDEPGVISLLCDLAEENPSVCDGELNRLLDWLVEDDRADPLDPARRLSDLFCLINLPGDFVAAEVAPRLGSTSGRVHQVLLRCCVYHRAVPLARHCGLITERHHGPDARHRSYTYHLTTEEGTWRLLDLSNDLHTNPSDLPKYAPSNRLRRLQGCQVEVEGALEYGGDGEPTLLLAQRIAQVFPADGADGDGDAGASQ